MKSLVIPELRAYAPFDQLEPEALDYLSERLQFAYHPRGEHSRVMEALVWLRRGLNPLRPGSVELNSRAQ